MTIINTILWGAIIVWAIYEIIQYFRRKNAADELTNEEFKENMRKVQIVDVREKADFDAGHILGARNVPYTQLKQRMNELRKDTPIYLYDEKKAISSRASLYLKKNGYTQLYRLKNGYSKWDGKIKKSKY
ncbi:rhodanese-like domain-containing protein [Lacticigenium naphthae]|uniref:rhodanese-like domain-containing protein n=1 Tax=Lacticigenium naphthae TaxID=515351 RepID=UPI00055743F1|nr:rhodanese-like domain-containing protein [Lacticigenium naphthae]